jgi:hypothetical protein
MAVTVKALFFDVFGTLVDWRTSIAREAEAMLKPLGFSLDWLAFADAWRGEYQGAMDEVRSGRIPFCKLDILHRRNLDLILPRCPARAQATQAPVSVGAGVERQHLADGRSGAAQRFALGRHPRRRDRR